MQDGSTPLWLAVWKGRVEVIRLLVESGADLEIPRGDVSTPLHMACKTGNVAVAAFLCVTRRGRLAKGEGRPPSLRSAALLPPSLRSAALLLRSAVVR
jgi:hypothetical protein